MSTDKNNSGSWMKGALYLSLGALAAKGLSALYKVPYQNLTGDLGYYVYQQVYPLYGLAFVLGTYGFPVVISGMLTEWKNNREYLKSGNADIFNRMITLLLCMLLFNGIIGGAFIFFAEEIAVFMGDSSLAGPIRWLGLPFFIIPFLALGRGFYQGEGNMAPAAWSQIGEQITRVIVILIVAFWAMQWGDSYLAGISAGVGALAGAISGTMLLLFFGWKRRGTALIPKIKQFTFPDSWAKDVKKLIISGLFVSVSAMSLVAMQLFDSFTVFRLLISSGIGAEEAAALKGIYDRGWPLVQLGALVTTAFSYAVVPMLTKAFMDNDRAEVQLLTGQAVKICLVFGGAAGTGLIVIMRSLNTMLFTNQAGTGTLQVLSVSVLFAALFMTSAALFYGTGKAWYSVLLLILGLLIKLAGNFALVPVYGIAGAAGSTAAAFFIISAVSVILLIREGLLRTYTKDFWLKWGLALTVMGVFVLLCRVIIDQVVDLQNAGRAVESLIALSSSAAGGLLFLTIIWYVKIFEKHEWEALPKISKFLPYK
ncbi:polysaccharide biosynthesis protein [Evansella sp. LMS18]|uniref:putative polysaccharide biosynthesis protein n=1 Tax=Evansella sp. LMS18 TaxID=2924033 RepID=UPI0020D02FBD|nr:polysaccharide biosynthesis protein [Evansella sp. LMS18]UTR12449.1 polysaccharide biosynthesis protein [Evansella sp. LMS18]